VVSTDHFRREIRSRFELASAQGQQRLILNGDELYRAVGKQTSYGQMEAMMSEQPMAQAVFHSNTISVNCCE
jgi:hypothetical protein